MHLDSTAKPYAKAIFALAEQDRTHKDWRATLDAASVLMQDADMQSFIKAPMVKIDDKVKVLVDLIATISEQELTNDKHNLIKLLAENKRLASLPKILDLFNQKCSESNDTKTFRVVSAQPLSNDDKIKITADLSQKYQTPARIKTELSEDLIAGVVIFDGDKVLDLSIKAAVSELDQAIN